MRLKSIQLSLSFLWCSFSIVQAEQSVARLWNEALLDAIRIDYPAPTVHSRNLFHLSAAMYDGWTAYQETSVPYRVDLKTTADNLAAARDTTISYAAYRLLSSRFTHSPGHQTSQAEFDALMVSLGYDKTITDVSTNSPEGLGNFIAQEYITFGLTDGSNESNDYADTSDYASLNPSLIFKLPGTTLLEPNHWQPLAFDFLVLQNGIIIGAAVQNFLGSHWGEVAPFSISKETSYNIYQDPGPPPQLDGLGDAEFKDAIVRVIRFSSQQTPDEDVIWDVSPSSRGNSTLGTNNGTGHPSNPATGLPYQPHFVKRGDYGRVLAEFWADGPSSETPPGHWNTIANYVSDHDLFRGQFEGSGQPLDRLEWDVKMYFALNGAVHDAAIAAWDIKEAYDYVRPISSIRYMGGLGQSTEPSGAAYHKNGLPLVEGLIELITEESAAAGNRHEHLSEAIGNIAILSWVGQPGDPENQYGGVDWILPENWMPYQRKTFVTPPFAGYVSGHSTFSRAGAEVLTALTGDPYFPGGLGVFQANTDFLEFEQGPSEAVTLQWATYYDASDEAGISRLWGGIHVDADDLMGRKIGSHIGQKAFTLAKQYFDGLAITEHPTNATIQPGTSHQLQLGARGHNLSFQWYQGSSGDTTHPITNATDNILQVTPTQPETYWARVSSSDEGSSAFVDSATARILPSHFYDSLNKGEGHKYADWLGDIYDGAYPYIYHYDQLGWLYCAPTSSNGIWFYETSLGWFWSSKSVYPYLFNQSQHSWIYYYMGSHQPKWFWNTSSKNWISYP